MYAIRSYYAAAWRLTRRQGKFRYRCMAMKGYVILEDRGLVTVGGEDSADFLQGLISNDIKKVSPDRAIWAALLTPQGKYLHDFRNNFV